MRKYFCVMTANIFVNGVIDQFSYEGDNTTSLADIRRQYESFDKVDDVTVFINTVGGDAYEGFAIRDYLRSLGKPITTIGEGKVYSIGTVILLAGDKEKRRARPNSSLIAHNPWTVTIGDADDHQRAERGLRQLEDRLANFYAQETNLTFEEAKALMVEDRAMEPDEMLKLGFISAIDEEEMEAVALFNMNNQISKMSTESVEKFEKKFEERAEGFFARLEKKFFKNQKDPIKDEKTNEDEAVDFKTTIKELQARVKELEAEVIISGHQKNEVEKSKIDLEAKVTELETEISNYKNQVVELNDKVKELEETPVIQETDKAGVYVAKGEKIHPGMNESVEALNKVAAQINKR